MEIVGGGTDINDPVEQRERFVEQRERQESGAEDDPHPHDEEFVRALEYGMPPASGCGLGIDRLLMIMTGAKTLRDVIILPRDARAAGRGTERPFCRGSPVGRPHPTVLARALSFARAQRLLLTDEWHGRAVDDVGRN